MFTPGMPGWPRPEFRLCGNRWRSPGTLSRWIEDPDGLRIALAEVPAGHPLRRDPRPALPPGRRTTCRLTARSAETRQPSARAVGGRSGSFLGRLGCRDHPQLVAFGGVICGGSKSVEHICGAFGLTAGPGAWIILVSCLDLGAERYPSAYARRSFDNRTPTRRYDRQLIGAFHFGMTAGKGDLRVTHLCRGGRY
jgi:hypothetical protein